MKYPGFPQIAGRVSRLKDKRIGRFGWKSQTASLSDFVLTACAVELGPRGARRTIRQARRSIPTPSPRVLILNAQECESLVAYVSDLPRPAEAKPESEREDSEIQRRPRPVCQGRLRDLPRRRSSARSTDLYSDLLLHDLGPALGDVGQYGVFDPSSSEEEIVDDPATVADATPAPACLRHDDAGLRPWRQSRQCR